jgi:hypothetical protein
MQPIRPHCTNTSRSGTRAGAADESAAVIAARYLAPGKSIKPI